MTENRPFKAMWVEEHAPAQFSRRVTQRQVSDLPEGEVLVRVRYSSLNYKDALSASGNKGVTRQYPHTPGIDAAGNVERSESPLYQPGDEVLVSAPEFGVSVPGGFGQYVRVPASWLMRLPNTLTLRESMAFGTAGFTAAMCVDRLQRDGITPGRGEVLVTGASGGVGSIAVGILAREGYAVVAATGKTDQAGLLLRLGAAEVIHREELEDESQKPMLHARWAGVVDTVGGKYLSTAIRATQPEGVVTACGNAASPDLPLTVYPFILRGVTLAGIDTNRPLRADRERLWSKLGDEWKLPEMHLLVHEVPLEVLDGEIERILHGGQTGRVVVNLR